MTSAVRAEPRPTAEAVRSECARAQHEPFLWGDARCRTRSDSRSRGRGARRTRAGRVPAPRILRRRSILIDQTWALDVLDASWICRSLQFRTSLEQGEIPIASDTHILHAPTLVLRCGARRVAGCRCGGRRIVSFLRSRPGQKGQNMRCAHVRWVDDQQPSNAPTAPAAMHLRPTSLAKLSG
jgi:hypothetical protein